jgi:hypothetical protein
MYSVYILESLKTGRFYIGYSADPERRQITVRACITWSHSIYGANPEACMFKIEKPRG